MNKSDDVIHLIMETFDNFESVIDSVMYTSLQSMVESQTILQLMVAKDMVTRDEVQEMREKVKHNSEYGKLMIKVLAKMGAESGYKDEIIKNLMQLKMFSPESLSESESDILAEMLQREYANKGRKELLDIIEKYKSGAELTEEEEQKVKDFLDRINGGQDTDE